MTKKIFFMMAALCLSFGLMEGIAWTVETFLFGRDPLYPLPLPGAMEPEMVSRLTALKHELSSGIPMVEDPERGWAFPPNTGTWPAGGGSYAHINSLGMRGPEVGPRKRGEVRILTLGDSSIYGDWVSLGEVFSNVAARSLSRRWRRPVTSVIGAVPGYDSQQSLLTLRKHGRTVNPTHVVIGNIWSDIYTDNGAPPRLARPNGLRSSLQRLACYRMLGRIIRPHLRPHLVRWITHEQDIGASLDGADSRVPLREYGRNLQLIVDETRALGAQPLFIMLPAPMDFNLAPPPGTVPNYREVMRQVANDAQAPLLDGPAYFRRQGANITHFKDQIHPNRKGHQLLGRGLAEIVGRMPPGPVKGAARR